MTIISIVIVSVIIVIVIIIITPVITITIKWVIVSVWVIRVPRAPPVIPFPIWCIIVIHIK